MFVLGWGRVYLDCWWDLGMVGKTRPYIIGMFDCFGKIWVRGDRLLGKFWLGAIECLFLGGGGFIYIVGGNWGGLVKPAPKELSGCLIVLGKFGLGAIDLKFDKIRYLENI